ncbi:thylakoid lumenal protein TL20.3, chloroplastic isoform X2 [Herrania umbratica]|uniref:Thylakoid lumenal protein TL20.3, chloroplastic isoform X2 n=1 Tax=Herrania umbratica TaxID=108875 RepID=A0A6J1BNS9_9ROSI|nr:thylakoid lumenal protein TL20.3, chloroplastic isoform X2 [Herrania umbratica]
MALASVSSLSINSLSISSSSSSKAPCYHLQSFSKRFGVFCQINNPEIKARIRDCSYNKYAVTDAKFKSWRALVSTALAAAMVAFVSDMSALAELNKYEAETRGEFGIGSAAQFGSADLRKAVHVNENFRRANFTAADMRESDFSGSTFNGAYLEKAVAYKANFTGADLSDTLMDRMVLNEANFTNAVLVRSVLTRSDLGGALIEGADFSDAVIDLPQKQSWPCRDLVMNIAMQPDLSLVPVWPYKQGAFLLLMCERFEIYKEASMAIRAPAKILTSVLHLMLIYLQNLEVFLIFNSFVNI